MEGKPEYPDGEARMRAQEALDRAVDEAMSTTERVRARRLGRQLKQQVNTPLPTNVSQILLGFQPEDPRTVRRAAARQKAYQRITAVVALAMICATALGIVWMIVK